MRNGKQQTDRLIEGLRVSQKVAVMANEATKVESALLAILKEVCAYSRWPIGHVYLPAEDESRQLRPTTLWQLEHPERFETFRRVTERTSFDPGIGLPGRVLTSGKPAWIIDVTKDSNFPRAKLAKDIGVKAGFGFPVLIGTEVVAVLEFFSAEAVEPDEQLLEIMAHVGTQLGRVFERQKSQEKLKAAQSHLIWAERMGAVGKLASGIAHDFNNYLSVIHGFAELIQMRHKNDKALLVQLEQILHASESGNALVRQLMTFTRQQPIELKALDINRVVTSMAQLIQQLVGERIRLKLELTSTPLMVKADPTGLEQMLMNLSSNARDAMRKEGALTIRTECIVMDQAFRSTRRWAQEGEYVRLSIQDTGGGMDPAVAEHIFEPFFTTKRLGQGTGLGMAVVYGLIKQHGGYIDLDTAPGQGTTFHLYFPCQPLASEAERDESLTISGAPTSTPAPAAVATQPQQWRVLVVDDESGSRLLCEQILEESYAVTTVSSGPEALKVLSREPVDVLLTDIQMPEMDGITFIKEATTLRPDIKVAAMSAFMTEDVRQRLRALSPQCQIIEKPLTIRVLQEAIGRCRWNS